MSFLPIGASIIGTAILGFINAILIGPRSIGGFEADVTIEEHHHDELAITEHPVEQGAAIADHAYKRPSAVVIKAGWSNSDPFGFGSANRVRDIYDGFIALQASRQPFVVITGKRAYTNMLISRLSVSTDEKTENALMMTCECREVIMVSTQTVTVPDASKMKSPEINGATQNTGTQQLAPAPNFNSGGSASP